MPSRSNHMKMIIHVCDVGINVDCGGGSPGMCTHYN